VSRVSGPSALMLYYVHGYVLFYISIFYVCFEFDIHNKKITSTTTTTIRRNANRQTPYNLET